MKAPIFYAKEVHSMNILVVGGGGREHAIIRSIKKKSGSEGNLCPAR